MPDEQRQLVVTVVADGTTVLYDDGTVGVDPADYPPNHRGDQVAELARIRGMMGQDAAAQLTVNLTRFLEQVLVRPPATVPAFAHELPARPPTMPAPPKAPVARPPSTRTPTGSRNGRVAGWLAVAYWLRDHPGSTRQDIRDALPFSGKHNGAQMLNNRLMHMKTNGYLVEQPGGRLYTRETNPQGKRLPHLPPDGGFITPVTRPRDAVRASVDGRKLAQRRKAQPNAQPLVVSPAEPPTTTNPPTTNHDLSTPVNNGSAEASIAI